MGERALWSREEGRAISREDAKSTHYVERLWCPAMQRHAPTTLLCRRGSRRPQSQRHHLSSSSPFSSSSSSSSLSNNGGLGEGVAISPEKKLALAKKLGLHGKSSKGLDAISRLRDRLQKSGELFKASPDFAIPEIRSARIEGAHLPAYVTRQVNRRGVVVVREALPETMALRLRESLLDYMLANGKWVRPPAVHDCYWSDAQVQAWEQPQFNSVISALNGLWHSPGGGVDFKRHLAYCDRAFVGKPCSPSGPGAAIAGPGLRRWTDPSCQNIYARIFQGEYEKWDPFSAIHRLPEAMISQPFRPWVGFISLAPWIKSGNLNVVPMMRVATAYMLLRPFLPDVPDDSMCGATEGSPLPVTEEWHAPLLNALVRLPPLSPGDAVFWHPDLIVAESTVVQPPDRQYAGMFVSSLPLCPQNSSFGAGQRDAFLRGVPPPQAGGVQGSTDCGEADFIGRATQDHLSLIGRRVLGLSTWPMGAAGTEGPLTHHNEILGLKPDAPLSLRSK